MQIQLLSDLHLELQEFTIPDTQADVIVLAGDIHQGAAGVEWAGREGERLGKPIVYIPGNHEYYTAKLSDTEQSLREAARATGVYFLNNDSVVIENTLFLGTTLWTNYRAPAYGSVEDAMAHCKRTMADHSLIYCGDRKFRPEDALSLHEESVTWLRRELASRPLSLPTVVITHHAPSLQCSHPEFGRDLTSGAFISDLDDLVAKADLWLYGHTHSSFDQLIRGTRVVSNPRGYPYERTFGFDPCKVVEAVREEPESGAHHG